MAATGEPLKMKTTSVWALLADVYFERDRTVVTVNVANAAALGNLHSHVVSHSQELTNHTGNCKFCVELVGAANLVCVSVLSSPLSAGFLCVWFERGAVNQ